MSMPFFRLLLLCTVAAACAGPSESTQPSGSSPAPEPVRKKPARDLPATAGASTPARLEAVEFYADEMKKMPPVMPLGSRNTLILRFDLIDTTARMFIVRAQHLNPDGTPSVLQLAEYMGGQLEDQLLSVRTNSLGQPLYHSYSYRFPTDQFNVTRSGAYALELLDFSTQEPVAKLPFYVVDEKLNGSLTFEEFLGAEGPRSIRIQPFVQLKPAARLPFPCQDLTVAFIQDRNWTDVRTNAVCDQSQSPSIRFHLPRNEAFFGNFEYRFLDLSSFRAQSARILQIDDTADPPRIRLTADNPEFTGAGAPDYFPFEGVQRLGTEARYTEILFRLQTAGAVSAESEIYVVGGFNRWTPGDAWKMRFNPLVREFELNRLLKEGRYRYGYVVRDPATGQFRPVATAFTSKDHEYTVLIFQKDPARPVYDLRGWVEGRR